MSHARLIKPRAAAFAVLLLLGSHSLVFAASSYFPRTLRSGMSGPDVLALQKILDSDPATAIKGVVPGQESGYFGDNTRDAVIRFQNKYKAEILTPSRLAAGTGTVGGATISVLNRIASADPTGVSAPTPAQAVAIAPSLSQQSANNANAANIAIAAQMDSLARSVGNSASVVQQSVQSNIQNGTVAVPASALSGSPTFSGLTLTGSLTSSGSASSSFANGIDLTGGCFSINGACITGSGGGGGGSGTVSAGVAGQLGFYSASGTTIAGSSSEQLTLGRFNATSSIASVFPYASTTALTSSGSAYLAASAGSVGIGTSSPTALLGLQGAIGVSLNQLYLAALGNIGIGTASPVDALQVAKDHANEGSDHTAQVTVSGATDSNMRLMLGYDTTDNNAFIQSFWHHTGATALALQPQGGNVGVGTTSPGQKLSVAGGIFTTASSTMMNGINLTDGCFAMNGTCITGGGGGGSGTVNSGTAGQAAYFLSNGTAVSGTSTLTISSAQNVGIGTSSPQTALAVSGSASFTGGVNTLTVAGASTGNPATIAAGGSDVSVPLLITSKSTWGSGPGGVDIATSSFPTAYNNYHSSIGTPPAPFDLVVGAQTVGAYNGISLPSVGPGAIASAGSTANYGYIEFAKFGGTVASPTATGANWFIGELAFDGYNGSSITEPLLMDVVTDSNTKGQLNLVFDTGGQSNPDYTFSADHAQFKTGYALFGSNNGKNTYTTGIQCRNTSGSCNFNGVRDVSTGYVYSGYTPDGSVSSSHPHWGAGLIASDYGYSIWSYDGGASNSVRLKIDPTGTIGIGTTTPSQKLDVNGSINIEGSSNGIIMHDTANGNCYIVQVTNGALAATAHACQ